MNIMKSSLAPALILSTTLLSGCASMLNGEHQVITVKTEPDTEIFINDRYAGKGFAKQTLPRDKQHTVKVVKEGCEDNGLVTQPDFNETSLLGLFVDFGLISIPTDFLTGAAWDIEPRDIQLAANCK